MEPVTLLDYINESGPHRKRINWFNAQSSFNEIYKRISHELQIRTFDLKINDPFGGFVDFDHDYLTSFRPYSVHQPSEKLGAVPTTLSPAIIHLKVIDTSGKKYL